MANDINANISTSKCSVCGELFKSFQECLKHELIQHTLQQKKNLKNHTNKRIIATAKALNNDEKLSERLKLRERLKRCKEGDELRTIFEVYCMNLDNLSLIFTRIQTCLEKELSPAGIVKIYPFGSIASELALRDCDIDIYLDASDIKLMPGNKRKDHKSTQRLVFNRICSLLYSSPHFSSISPIRGARVPIIKCNHNDTGFNIDINISHPSSRENTKFVYDLVKSDERIHGLMLFLKIWAKNMQIIGRDNMVCYCLISMIIFFLQQPWTPETQENISSDYRILKSVKELQANCEFRMVQGINYAYDLSDIENKPKVPTTVTTWDLIKGFFKFYKDFNFEEYIISPFYGISVQKTNLTPDICQEYYKQLQTITQHLHGEKPHDLQIDRCMCVQDPFCLNQNTAKSMQPRCKKYFILCLQNADNICENPNQLKLGELYEKLLFDTIKITGNLNGPNVFSNSNVIESLNLEKIKLSVPWTLPVNNNEDRMVYKIAPSKADVRTIINHCMKMSDFETTFRCWCQHYVKVTEIIITKLYRMDIQQQVPSLQKQQKLDQDVEENELNRSWQISCRIDLWSNRCYQKSQNKSFMSYQLEQTDRLHNLRRQDPKYSVSLNAILNVNIFPNYEGLMVQLETPKGTTPVSLGKKSPLHKFFKSFKNVLQNWNIKESLSIDATNFISTNEINQPFETTKAAEDIIPTLKTDNL